MWSTVAESITGLKPDMSERPAPLWDKEKK